jgi:hypothetical protein
MSLLTQFYSGISGVVVQQGVTVAAATITISAVNLTNAVVISYSKGSAGSVAVSGSVSLSSQFGVNNGQGVRAVASTGSRATTTASMPNYNGTVSGGTTNIMTSLYSAQLTNATTLVCDGPVQWQVISY